MMIWILSSLQSPLVLPSSKSSSSLLVLPSSKSPLPLVMPISKSPSSPKVLPSLPFPPLEHHLVLRLHLHWLPSGLWPHHAAQICLVLPVRQLSLVVLIPWLGLEPPSPGLHLALSTHQLHLGSTLPLPWPSSLKFCRAPSGSNLFSHHPGCATDCRLIPPPLFSYQALLSLRLHHCPMVC